MEGEVLPFYQHELKVGVDSDQQAIFFIWPMVVVHQIDKDSPLYTISAADLAREKFEIVVILEGVIESTGATTQARTSYLPSGRELCTSDTILRRCSWKSYRLRN